MSEPGRMPSRNPASAAYGDTQVAPGTAPSGVRPLGSAPAQPAAPASGNDPLIGTTIDGRYIVEGILGEGGMGVVYGARHVHIDRKVALKVLRSEFAKDREIVDRFLQEA